MLKDYFKLALKSIKHRKLRSWLTMIGIFIGIAAVVSLISLGQGMQNAIRQQFLSIGANTITIQPKGGGFGPPGTLSATELTERDLEEIQRVSGVTSAFGRLIRPMEVNFNDQTEFIYTATLPDDKEDREYLYSARNIEVLEGRDLSTDSTYDILIGNDYYKDEVFGRTLRPGDKLTLNGQRVEVAGALKRSGSPEVDISFLINEEALRDIIGVYEEYDAILARTVEGEVDQVADRIERSLRKLHGLEEGEEDFVVETSQELLESFQSIINIVQMVLIGIAAISLLVGGIGITNTMFTSVLERTQEIGVMKSIGAKNSDILTLFILESGMLGLAGGAIGVGLGIGLSELVEYIAVQYGGITLLQASFPPYLIVGSLVFSFLVGTISGVMPARRASKMDPVEALRE